MCLKISDNFKVVRDGRIVFPKWMDNMFDEYFKQGDIEKQLDIPISKFMCRNTTNKAKAYLNYINVVSMPLFSTFMILIQDDEVNNTVMKEGIIKNKKMLE